MKSFAALFKRYRLRAEFDSFSSFSNALAEKGFFYDESIFSHWQKGTRVPTNRKLILKVIEIFVEKQAIKTIEDADEILSSTGLGYLTDHERKSLGLKIKIMSNMSVRKVLLVCSLIFIFSLSFIILIYTYLFPVFQKNYIDTAHTVASAVTEPKKLVIGIDATLEPMEYIENEKLIGYDIDLGTQLAKELGADLEFRNIIFDNLFNALDQRQINMIISAVTIIDARKQKYDFSEPYLNAGQVIVTKSETTTIKGVTDLKGKRIATQTGTTNEKEALKYTSDKLVIRYPNFVHATNALHEGKVDALFTDLPNAKRLTSNNKDLKIAGKPFTQEYYGIVFIKGDPSITQINEALNTLRKRGILADLEEKWLE